MGYLYLLISLITGATKGLFGKKVSTLVTGTRGAAATNLLRMVLCTVISILLLVTGIEKASLVPDGPAILIGIGAGIFLSMFTITWLLAVQKGAFVLISVAQMFGVVVTLVCSVLVFGTQPTLLQYLGIALLMGAVLVMGSYSKKLKGGLSAVAILLLILCGVSSGLYDFTLKLFTTYSVSSKSMLNLLTYLVSALILGGMVLLPQKEEKAAARAEAEAILNEWKSGDATEESFASLANAKSDDVDPENPNGGLYEDIYPGKMVAAFEDWCFDNRKAGDTGIVETEFGCHVMFYAGDSETTYRDHLISGELAANDFNAWYAAIVDAVTPTEHDFKYIKTDLVLAAA